MSISIRGSGQSVVRVREYIKFIIIDDEKICNSAVVRLTSEKKNKPREKN